MTNLPIVILFICVIVQEIQIIILRTKIDYERTRISMILGQIITCLLDDDIKNKARSCFAIFIKEINATDSSK